MPYLNNEKQFEVGLREGAHSLDFAKISIEVERLALALSPVGAGRFLVVASLPSGIAFTLLQLAVSRAQCVFLPLAQDLTVAEIQRALRGLEPDLIISSSSAKAAPYFELRFARAAFAYVASGCEGIASLAGAITESLAKRGAEVDPIRLPNDLRLLQPTSGTTGDAKLLAIGESALSNNVISAWEFWGNSDGPAFCPVPQFHAMGNAAVLELLSNGIGVVFPVGFMWGEHLKLLKEHGCSKVIASPNYYFAILRLEKFSEANLPNLRTLAIGSDRISSKLIDSLRLRFPSSEIVCRYGLSESVGALFVLRLLPGERLPAEGCIGAAMSDVRYVSLGEGIVDGLTISSSRMASGYFVNGEVEAIADEAGFFATGDLISEGPSGVLLHGRESLFIKSNGFRLSPIEIEEVLMEYPGIECAVVVGVNDGVVGQRIVACIVTKLVDCESLRAELIRFCVTRLSKKKIPAEWRWDVDIPYTPSGKVARGELIKKLSGEQI